MQTPLALDVDRLLPADPATREIAHKLLDLVEALPIISPHGHVEAALLRDDEAFPDPATLLITTDHYVTRLIHASGVSLDRLGKGVTPASPREVWREFCRAWPLFEGTASGYWLRSEFTSIFKLREEISEETADRSYDEIADILQRPEFRPRALFADFGIEVLATTDDPLDSLDAHRELAADPTVTGRVLPTFRPDAYLNLYTPGWNEKVELLVATAADGLAGYDGYVRALANRRQYFIEHGAVSADHGVKTAATVKLGRNEAERLFEAARAGQASAADRDLFEAHMMYEMARMSVEDGLVMTLHPGVYRNHHKPTFDSFGGDTGHDIPVPVSYVEGLAPLLNDFGTAAGFHLVLFTIDETVWSRELAPLAGFYPSVYLGAPWWFLDSPDAIQRFRAATTETAGFSRSSGFIDDTRAFCSIPARHNTARRVEAAYLARLVAEKRVSEDRARDIIVDIVDAAPRRVFKL